MLKMRGENNLRARGLQLLGRRDHRVLVVTCRHEAASARIVLDLFEKRACRCRPASEPVELGAGRLGIFVAAGVIATTGAAAAGTAATAPEAAVAPPRPAGGSVDGGRASGALPVPSSD